MLSLRSILGGLVKEKTTNDDVAKVKNLPKYKQVALALDQLAARDESLRKQSPFNFIKATTVSLEAIDVNIMALTIRIGNYCSKIESGEGLSPQDCFTEMKKVTLDRFFTDEDDLYIPIKTYYEFIDVSRRLFAAIDKGYERNDRGIESTVRLLNKCFNSIQNVCKAAEESR